MKTLLLLGDSLIEWGDWPSLLPDIQTINRGIAGETLADLSVRLLDEVEGQQKVDHILIMSGTNDLLQGNHFFPAIYRGLIPRLLSLCPETDITINSLMPMSLPWIKSDLVESLNNQLQEIASHCGCGFLDTVPQFTLHCLPITHPGFLNDGVHLSSRGYSVWARTIDDYLKTSQQVHGQS